MGRCHSLRRMQKKAVEKPGIIHGAQSQINARGNAPDHYAMIDIEVIMWILRLFRKKKPSTLANRLWAMVFHESKSERRLKWGRASIAQVARQERLPSL